MIRKHGKRKNDISVIKCPWHGIRFQLLHCCIMDCFHVNVRRDARLNYLKDVVLGEVENKVCTLYPHGEYTPLFPSRTLCWSCLLHSCPAVTCGPSLLSRTTVGDGSISSGLLWVAGSWRAATKRTRSRWRTSWQPSTLGSPMLQSRAGTAIIKFTFASKGSWLHYLVIYLYESILKIFYLQSRNSL